MSFISLGLKLVQYQMKYAKPAYNIKKGAISLKTQLLAFLPSDSKSFTMMITMAKHHQFDF